MLFVVFTVQANYLFELQVICPYIKLNYKTLSIASKKPYRVYNPDSVGNSHADCR
jgi:hypothetical protein